MEGLVVTLVNVYAPTSGPEQLRFYQQASAFLGFLDPQRPGLAYWHFSNSLLEDVGFMASFREFWLAWRGQRHAFPSALRWWDLGKVHARLFCHDYTQGASRQRDATIQQLKQEVLELERRLAISLEDPSLCGVCWEKWEELWALKDHQAQGVFVCSCIRFLWEMGRGSHFFYTLEKRRGDQEARHLPSGRGQQPLTDPAEMCRRARIFYAVLFSPIRQILTLAECSGMDS
ncbi:unnamed protein product [Caretta caretta]